VLSSRIIPGNEQTVYGIINDLERRGIEVRYRTTDPDVHVSGHACRDEQRKMIDLTEPTGFLPIHGTFHHLTRHARLAHEAGVEDTLVVENGAIVELDDDGLRVGGAASTGRVHVDAGEEIPDVVLRDRALLAELGMAIVVIVVDRQGVLLREPDVVTRGVVHEEAEPELLSAAREYVADALRAYKSPLLEADEGELRDIARRALKRFFARKLGRKPLTYGVVVRVA